jgi:hypothetical protein
MTNLILAVPAPAAIVLSQRDAAGRLPVDGVRGATMPAKG